MAHIPQAIRDRLPDWKAKYGEVFFVPQGSSGFVLRTFTLGEYEDFQAKSQVAPELAESELVQSCLLYPDDFNVDTLSTGDFLILVGKLMEVSPFDNADRFMEKFSTYRELTSSLIYAIYIHITAAFPSMRVADIRQLSCDEILLHLALAERILQRKLEIEGEGEVASIPELPETQNPRVIQAQRAALAKQRLRRRQAAQMGQPVPEDDPNPPIPGRLSLMKDASDMGRALGVRPDGSA